MEPEKIRHRQVISSAEAQICIRLIVEELKTRKLFHGLHELGFEDCYLQPNLDEFILQCVGLRDDSDDIFKTYTAIMNKRSAKIRKDGDMIIKQAVKAYREIVQIKSTAPGK